MAGIYIHIPFCASRCIYCGFYSTTGKEKYQDRYTDALLKEYNIRKKYLENENIDTIYIGGGTPSTLSEHNLRRLVDGIKGNPKEFTMECNPDDITQEFCYTLYNIGINRVSLGVQTFSDNRLRFLNRRHNSSQIVPAINALRNAGIKNISIDLMFGFPNQTIEQWEEDIKTATSLNVEHISAYSLMYEEGTRLAKMRDTGETEEIDEETSVRMYDILIDTLTAKGYEHYEISNFAKPGYHSIHNSNYWNGTKYLGLGAAAHSYDGISRQWNVSDIRKYIEDIERGTIPMEKEMIDEDTRYNDIITTALRTRNGIDLNRISQKHLKYLTENARKSISDGLLCIDGNRLHLTRKGLYVSDSIMADLIWV